MTDDSSRDAAGPPTPERRGEALRALRASRDEVDRLLAIETHPLQRYELERMANWLETQIRAWKTQDADQLEEANRIRERAPLGLRDLAELPPDAAWLLTERNLARWREAGAPGQVWLRWDHLGLEQRASAASLGSYLRDLTGKRKPAGRPRKNSPEK